MPFHRIFLLLAVAIIGECAAQPAQRLHTDSKKAIKLYRRAVERSRQAMVPGTNREAMQTEVEADLLKALSLDSTFAEAERILAALRFDQGDHVASRDHYAHFLAHSGPDWIRDHFSWAEAARHALDPESMKEAMSSMLAIPGVAEGPDVEAIQRMMKDAEFMSMALRSPGPSVPMVLPEPVSTGENEYFPSVWLGGDALIFTRQVADGRSALGQEDLFVVRHDGAGNWGQPQPLRGLNSSDNEGAASLSGDGKTLCFTLCRDAAPSGRGSHQGSCDLYMSEQVDGQWSLPINLSSVNTTGWESQPCLTPDGNRLYFTRGTGKAGRRKYDLFVSRRQEDGQWGLPVRLGGRINSDGKEMRPFIHPDGRHFYFSSDGRPGMGGMDVFVSTMGPDGQWGEPVNLGWPLNTPEDETGLVVSSDGRTAYFSRSVDGQLDLHSVQLPPKLAAEPTAAMEGRLMAPEGWGLSDARITLVDRDSGVEFAVADAAVDGTYHVPVPLDRAFVVTAQAPGRMLVSEAIDAGQVQGRVNRDFILSPLEQGSEVVLRNVFFDSGSAALTPESRAELEMVATWLIRHANVRVELGGHTDDVGSAKDNAVLSAARAAAVMDALKEAGADPDRLSAVGYGNTLPAVQGTTDTARQQNRRTTMTVLSWD